jgi:glyoxylase-like metal-dependent hydrolase (beta-lactamase superfamily II)
MSVYPVNLDIKPEIKMFFDEDSSTFSYVVTDPDSNACAIIDSVMDINYAAGGISHEHANEIIAYIKDNGLELKWLLETHVHADHLSAAPYIQSKLGGKIGIGKNITIIQDVFGKIFNEGTEFQRDGSQFDALFADRDTFTIGTMRGFSMHTPGHTPACMVYVIGNAAFVGDTLFMPDAGTARADFPGGDAGKLFDSVQKVLTLPDSMELFMCHDYGPGGREILYKTTVGEQKRTNIHAGEGHNRDEFIKIRQARDATLSVPRLIIPSLQINMRAGNLPPADKNGKTFLKVPVNVLGK